MRPIRPTRLATALAALALMLAPAAARADGDPASDYLLIQDTFLPFQFKVSPNVATALQTAVARAKAAGYPLKVAVISAPTDLGAVPDLFGKPQQYADFLDREISFNKKALLLVVMPQGFGVSGTGPASVLAGRTVPAGTGSDRLARAAIPAVGALAAHAGHPISLPTVGAAIGSSGGTSALLTFGAPLALVLLVAGGAALFKSRAGPAEPLLDDADDDELDDEETGHPDPAASGSASPPDPAASGSATPADPPVGLEDPTAASGSASPADPPVGGEDPTAAAAHPDAATAASSVPAAAGAGADAGAVGPGAAGAGSDAGAVGSGATGAELDAIPPEPAARPPAPPGTGG